MEAGKGKSRDLGLSQAVAYRVAQKGCVLRPRFMRPFAQCFASAEDGQPVCLLTSVGRFDRRIP
jgi:hypothetical protein